MLSGREFTNAVAFGLRWLEANADAIDRLNVYPVPDGDTGTNMVLTLRAAMKEIPDHPSDDVSVVAAALSRGALLGARGNSGVILSQILRGFAEGLDGRSRLGVVEFVEALECAYEVGYRAVTHPVEGTILTVARDASVAAASVLTDVSTVDELLAQVVEATRRSVANTPNQLPVLAEAGVVDAGGQGLHVVYEGMLRYLRGEPMLEMVGADRVKDRFAAFAEAHQSDEHGYCTEFVIYGKQLDVEALQNELGFLGGSLLVVGDEEVVRVHVHTERPGDVVNAAVAYGEIDQLTANDMNRQQDSNFSEVLAGSGDERSGNGVVAVVSGQGLEQVFRSLGADVVYGGQSMNPSVSELLEAIDRVPDDWAILLPNNTNILLTAQKAAEKADKDVRIVPTRTIVQGVGAVVAFNPTGTFDSNVDVMTAAADEITTIEISQAVRDSVVDGISISQGEYIGLLENDIVEHGTELNSVVMDVIARLRDGDYDIITIYSGRNTSSEMVEDLTALIAARYPRLDVETIVGGQEHIDYVISVE